MKVEGGGSELAGKMTGAVADTQLSAHRRGATKPGLNPQLAQLRAAALERHGAGACRVPALPSIDAQAWLQHTDDEDWLLWRARRVAARLAAIPIELSPGERIVGRPELREPTAEETAKTERLAEVLDAIPPFPGGDAGHFHPDYEKLFKLGIGGIRAEIQERLGSAATAEQRAFYQACGIAMQGLSRYALRVAGACEQSADAGSTERGDLARICRRVAAEPPATFHEAIQLMYLAIIGLWFGEDHGLTTPGRMDQTLRPFYEADLAAGRITRQQALELICCLYIQLNMVLGPGSAISVMVGGRDRHGRDATCELTYLCLEARQATQLAYPTVGLAWHEETPAELTGFACRMIRTGIGDPAFFNDELIASGLRDLGVAESDCYSYMNSTCVEIKVVGASNVWVTSPYFNCPQALLEVLDAIVDGVLPEPLDFAAFNRLVEERMTTVVGDAAQRLDCTWRQRAETGCFPLASCLIDDCLASGVDFDRGGARYNWVENSFVGLANLVDGLMAIRGLVYDAGELTLDTFRAALQADFEGSEPLRQRILNRLPSYGNDEDGVDALAAGWARFLQQITGSQTIGSHPYVPGFFCWVMHERLGTATGATPDGRKAGFPLADGAGAAQGREKHGPTASLLSTTKWDHRKALGGLVHNVKFSQRALAGDEDLQALQGLIETYLRRGGFEIQVNVVSADQLRKAQERPEEYADLLVRVAGYSDYFVHLEPNMQAEVIARTEHGGF